MKNQINSAKHLVSLIFILTALISCNTTPYHKIKDGLIVNIKNQEKKGDYSVRLQVVTDKIIHVTAIPGDKFVDEKSLMVLDTITPRAEFTIAEKGDTIILKTTSVHVRVLHSTGEVLFTDTTGKVLLAEKRGGGKSYEPVSIDKNDYLSVRQQFESQADEALYGLGSNQTEYMNLKGKDADLFQYNTQAVVPFLISTKNYGILWDNNSRTKFGDVRDLAELSGLKLYDKEGKEGGLTAVYSDKKDLKKIFTTRTEKEINYQFIPDLKKFPEGFNLAEGAVSWEGFFASDVSGLHKFMFTSAGIGRAHV